MQVQSYERMTGKTVTDEMWAFEQQSRIGAYFGIVFVFIFMTIWSLIQTAILWAIFNALLGAPPRSSRCWPS